MTPDSFFKINPNIQPGALSSVDRDSRRVHPSSLEKQGKDFKKILSRRERKEEDEDTSSKKTSIEDEILKEAGEEKMAVDRRKQPKKEFLDPDFNQTPTLAKESKVAPKIGKEKPIAPSEEPWSSPAIEANKDEDLKTAFKKSLDADKGMKSPAELFGQLAQEKTSFLKKLNLDEEIKNSLPQVDDLEISGSSKKGLSLIPEKSIDQDLASVNLFVLALGPKDQLIYADKIKLSAQDIPPDILKLCEEITNNMNSDMTKTTLVLKNAGLFNGVEVTVTSFKTAHGEINIQFANLTQQAKDVLDINLDSLKQALDQKGYTVHMIATTTIKDEPIIADSGRKTRDEKDESQGQKKEQDNNEEENG